MTPPDDLQHFENILQHLQQTRGFDFTAYKRTSLMRRVQRRMQAVAAESYEAYYDYLQVHQDEFATLFNTILINVTGFFRDQDVWDYLKTSVLPGVIAARAAEEPIRVWSAGCASGQEAYSMLMVMAELMGLEAVRDRVKIYATDADDEALNEARAATFSDKSVEDIPPPLLHKYFERGAGGYTFRRELRRSVIFGRHDLVQDAPISRVDFLLCRNTLMYFNADAQSRILARFFFSLNPGGHILLGRAEMLFSHSAMFTPVDLKRRVFKVVSRPNHRDRLLLLAQTGRDIPSNGMPNSNRLREAAFETDRMPQIVLDTGGMLVGANAPARAHFGIGHRDFGRPLQDLDLSFRPAELRAPIARATEERAEIVSRDVRWSVNGDSRIYDVIVSPLFDDDKTLIGTSITYEDVTDMRTLQNELRESKQELETAYEELQSTNEELETTNEELQSTVEELETTNEELQSTNEELETMNEELQSTNEELQSTNDELRTRSTDLNSANSFLESVFASLRSAVIVVDRDFRVLVWNEQATDMWGIRQDEALGSNLLSLDMGLPVSELRQPIRTVVSGASDSSELTVAATNRRGKPIQCRVTIGPLRQFDRAAQGAILLMDEHVAQGA